MPYLTIKDNLKWLKISAILEYLNILGGDQKYDEDFFYIAPLYHLAFTKLEKLIVLDVQDLGNYHYFFLLEKASSIIEKS